MRKLLRSIIFMIAALPSAVCAQQDEEGNDHHTIVPSREGTTLPLAQPMTFDVTYQNDSRDSWTVYRPDQCTCVLIRAVSDNRYYARVGFNLGKSGFVRSRLPNGSEVVARTVEIPPQLTIEPGDGFSFQVDLNSPFRSALRAGRWDFSVTDRMEKLTSVSLRFVIVVTRHSVDRCLEVMNGELLDRYGRGWHGGYLARVRPDLPFDFRGRNRTPEELAEVQATNKEALEEFRTWWAEERDSEEVDEALERINEEAGVLEEYRKLRDELAAVADEEEAAGKSEPDN